MSKYEKLTGYPSIDKPWLKYYREEAINATMPECTMYDYLWNANKNNLDDIALNYFDRKITFCEMFNEIDRVANAFASIGVKRGDVVVLATVTTPETIYTVYGLNRLGAIANMVDPRTSVEGIREYIEETNAEYALCIDVAYKKIQEAIVGTTIKKVIVASPVESLSKIKKFFYKLQNGLSNVEIKQNSSCIAWSELYRLRNEVISLSEYKKNACCVIEHTGGTTGMPKGVMLTDDNFNGAAEQIKNSPLLLKRRDKFLNIIPPFVAYGMVLGIHIALTHGWESIIVPKFEPKNFSNLILKYRPAGIMGVPTYFEGLMNDVKLKGKDLSFIKVVLVGGDKIFEDFEKEVNEFFVLHNAKLHLSKGYSMTEASATATFSFEEINKVGSAGIPFTHTIVAAFEPNTDKELKFNETGEICISTPTMMSGYYGKRGETENVIKKHSDGRKWIHSGDLGYIDEDGCVYIEGRIKRMIIRYDGFKVFPSFIENVIVKHNGVENCCAVGMVDKEHCQGKLPVVYIVLKPEYVGRGEDVEKELIVLCKQELPEYAQPVGYKFCDKLPLTGIGKIDYRALENIC